ncbi:MAG: hypothetical protein JWO98_4519 [Frankiales bacterium]|nr:hypothetical protein [Frankiales bacterium]
MSTEGDGLDVAAVQDELPPNAEFLEAYNRFAMGARLQSVEQLKLTAERIAQGPATNFDFSLETEVAILEDHVFYRYDGSADLKDADGNSVCPVFASVVLAFGYDGEAPSEDVAGRYGLTTGMILAHPYLREAIQTLAARLGFPQVALPLAPIPQGPPTAS